MEIIPIVFAFDSNMLFPASICMTSLLTNAKKTTFYDIYILYSEKVELDKHFLDIICTEFKNCRLQYRAVDTTFDSAFEIRNITTSAYYRLLIPDIIPEYEKILYSDVDAIFRDDLSNVYFNTDLDDYYIAGVDSIAHMVPDLKEYYEQERKADSRGNIYSGNLIINSKKMREDGIVNKFRDHVDKKYKFQDMDIINIVCKGKIKYLSPSFCYTTYISDFAVNNREALRTVWSEEEIQEAQDRGIVHYNGQKPWRGACINFDIWWEYYRKSPFFDAKYYYQFFENMLNEQDRLPLMKRIKILARYFIYGRK